MEVIYLFLVLVAFFQCYTVAQIEEKSEKEKFEIKLLNAMNQIPERSNFVHREMERRKMLTSSYPKMMKLRKNNEKKADSSVQFESHDKVKEPLMSNFQQAKRANVKRLRKRGIGFVMDRQKACIGGQTAVEIVRTVFENLPSANDVVEVLQAVQGIFNQNTRATNNNSNGTK